MTFILPRLQKALRLVDRDGTPALTFLRWFNVDFAGAIETQEAAQAATDQELIEINDVQDMLIDDLTEAQADIIEQQAGLSVAVQQIQALLGISQSAAQAANDAQTTADAALAAGSVSGSATDPAVTLTGPGWETGPLVALSSVLAGDLTVAGSGPQQDSNVTIPAGGAFTGEYRLVEVIGGVDTVLDTWTFSAFQGVGEPIATVTNDSAPAVSAFISARASTGLVDYRLDARATSGTITELKLYVYARRAA